MDFLYLNQKKLVENYLYWRQLAEKNEASLNVVTKFCLSESEFVDVLVKQGADTFSDSNIKNFEQFSDEQRKKLQCCVIKTRVSDIKDYGKFAQAQKALGQKIPKQKPVRFYLSDEACLKEIKKIPDEFRPQIVLIMECGDYKDGLFQNDIKKLTEKYCDLPILGVSANFACLSGKMPDIQSLHMLCETALYIQKIRNLEKPFVSVGGTVMHDLLESGKIQKQKDVFISEVRCGEGIFFGYNSSKGAEIKGLNNDVFKFAAEIIEIQEKEIPEQKNDGLNALGQYSLPRPSGKRICAVLDFGILAAPQSDLFSEDKAIVIVGQTFDFTVADVTESKKQYHTGDFIYFYINYSSASFLCMNRFVERKVN